MISSSQRPLPDNTRHSQQTNIHAPGGIRTQDLNRRAACGRSPAEILYDISSLRVNTISGIVTLVLVAVRYTGRPLTHTDYTRSCIHTIVLLRTRTEFLKHVKVKCTLVQALRLCTGRTAHRGSRGIALLFHDHGTRRG